MKKKIRLIAVLLALVLLFSSCARSKPAVQANADDFKTNYTYVFVHGLSGWGSYDTANKFLKYWGMFGGDLMKYLNKQGFNCVSASVAPHGSAWDRACELYAQLTGSVVDYGEAHSKKCNHERFGTDYSDKPLIEDWDSKNKINLLGHSFGGATVRLLSELMANGSADEIAATDSEGISPLFTGGKADWIYSITALAAPHNGTTAYDVGDVEDDVSNSPKHFIQDKLNSLMASANSEEDDGRADFDNANYDMLLDNAKALNERISTLPNVYYFSIPCSSCTGNDDGTYSPDESKTEMLFVKTARLMGKFTETSEGGVVADESWLENDGLVNTISATAPFNAPQTQYREGEVKAGEWNIMPTYDGDHMSLQGGLFKTNDVRDFYTAHLMMINSLEG
ncbi:MAG: hypothetical protein E7571_01010 [Ruminococcaceae bacterium]|nr:hypothetical protein [Oscillospiraceae bacterium]